MALHKYKSFLETKVNHVEDIKPKKLNIKDPAGDICISMILLNNEFLDKILDMGIKSRYTENSQVFITDLKNLVLAKNRLHIGKFINDKECASDNDTSEINNIFNNIDFNIERDWNKLVNYRIAARNIIDKLIPNKKLKEDDIKAIYWNINRDKEHKEDIVIETNDGKQFSMFLNKNMNLSKSASFNTLADDLIGAEFDNLHSDEYMSKWNKLTQTWVKTLYENANKNIQIYIEKFIEPERIDTLGYFEYFDIKHRDPRYQNLGEYIKEFDKNVLYLSDLMSLIWKNREECFMDPEIVYNTWMETKILLLNSRILEHIFTESLTKNNRDEITKLDNKFKLAEGNLKMKIVKTYVEKLGCMERTAYYLGNNGNIFHQVPDRSFFRNNYDRLSTQFDYHVKMLIDEDEEENNDFIIHTKMLIDNEPFIDCDISVRFISGEMSGKLGARYKFTPADDFNMKVSD